MKKVLSFLMVMITLMLAACISNIPGKDPGPPEPVSFSAELELKAMMTAVERGEDMFADFLKEYPQFAGKVSFSEMKHFQQKLRTAGYPTVDSIQPVESFTATYYAHSSSPMDYEVIYRINGIRYRFVYDENKEENSRFGQVPVVTCEIDGETVSLYRGTDNIVGEIYKNGYQIRITVSSYDSIENISFEPFRWSYDIYLPPPVDA